VNGESSPRRWRPCGGSAGLAAEGSEMRRSRILCGGEHVFAMNRTTSRWPALPGGERACLAVERGTLRWSADLCGEARSLAVFLAPLRYTRLPRGQSANHAVSLSLHRKASPLCCEWPIFALDGEALRSFPCPAARQEEVAESKEALRWTGGPCGGRRSLAVKPGPWKAPAAYARASSGESQGVPGSNRAGRNQCWLVLSDAPGDLFCPASL